MKALSLLLLVFFIAACGIFTKNKTREKSRVKKEKTEIVVEEKGVTVHQKEQDTEITEIVIRMPPGRDYIDDSLVLQYESLQDAISDAIRNSEMTTFRQTRTQTNESRSQDTSKRREERKAKIDSMENDMALQKDGDTSWAANFNAWVILGVAAMVIGAVFLYFKFK